MTNTNANNSNYLNNHIIPDPNDGLAEFFYQTPFLKWCLETNDELSDLMTEQIALIFRSCKAFKLWERQFISKLSKEQQIIYKKAQQEKPNMKVSYQILEALGYIPTTEEQAKGSPLEYARDIQKLHQYKVRGLYFNDKNKLQQEANTFAEYLLSRIPLVQSDLNDIYRYTDSGIYAPITKNIVKKLCRDILNEAGGTLWNKRFENEYMAAFEHVIPYIQQFDTDPNIINFTNGLLNIQTHEFINHTSDYMSKKQLPYDYDPAAQCPNFERFLTDIFEKDQDRIRLVQQMMGYLWLKEIKIHKAFIFLGNGSNGKSVLAKIIHQLVGPENAATTSLEKFEGRFGLQDLPGKLVNISSENEFTKVFSTENLKQVTSGDALTVERKFQDAYTTTLYTKVIMLLNRMMDSKDTTDAYLRRLQIIPCNRRFVELKQGESPVEGVSYMNPNLVDELKQELPGIFNFSMIGLKDLLDNDFQLVSSEICNEALAVYQRQQNPVVSFMEDRIEYAPGEKILRPQISEEFTRWHEQNELGSYRRLGNQALLQAVQMEISRNGWIIETVKIDGHHYYKNLSFKENEPLVGSYVTATI